MPTQVNYSQMRFLIILVLFSMFYFVNSLYYSLSLLLLVVAFLIYLVSHLLLSSLTIIIMCIVYIGAIMILIGYICAICPNVIVSSSFSSFFLLFFFPFTFSIIFFGDLSFSFPSSSSSLVDYFYSSFGVFLFMCIVLMLFVTLLIVTSQYLTPKGPFRSVS